MAYNNINLVNEINRAGSITRLALDGYGNPLSITDPNDNAEETMEYDPLYRLARATDSLGGSSALSHSRRTRLHRRGRATAPPPAAVIMECVVAECFFFRLSLEILKYRLRTLSARQDSL